LPFGMLREVVMPFEAFRAPSRFIFLAVVAACWWATAGLTTLASRAAPRRAGWILAAVIAVVWLESVPMALLAAPVPVDGRAGRMPLPVPAPSGAILTLPAPHGEADEGVLDALWIHRALATGYPVTGGMSGWVPPATRRLRRELSRCEAGRRPVAALLDSLQRQGIVGVELCVAGVDRQRADFWQRALAEAGYLGQASAPGYRFYSLEP
jgi:hypothetical protein